MPLWAIKYVDIDDRWKLSVPEGTLADWPADAAIALRPSAGDGPRAA